MLHAAIGNAGPAIPLALFVECIDAKGDATLMISTAEYERLKRRDRLVRRPWEFGEGEIDAIRRV
jgi:hypothetical protein